MVAPIRDFGNKSVFFSSNMHSQQSFQLPTVFSSNYIEIDDIFIGTSSDNFNEVRERTLSSNVQVSRNSSVSFTKSSIAYHERMEHNNIMIEDVDIDNVSPGLSYKVIQEKAIQVSKAANTNNNTVTMTQQYVFHKHSNTTSAHDNNIVINIPLLYNPNTLTEPNL